jgi:hypothetical protein
MDRTLTPAQRLTLARIKAGYADPKDFYEAFGIAQSTYSLHESGQRGIRPKVADKYASYLRNCTGAWLLYGEGQGPDALRPTGGDPSVDAAAEHRHQEAAAFLLLYDRITALTDDNNKALGREFDIVFHHYGYDSGHRGAVQLAFRLWREIAEEDSDLSLPERALKKIEWLDAAFDALKESLRKVKRLFDAPDELP